MSCLAFIATPAAAQVTRVRQLSATDRQQGDGFTNIVGIRELHDKRVIVVDHLERSINILSADLTIADQIGRTGSGPGEYILPSKIIALAGDSSAVLDAPNNRFLVLMPDASIGGTLDLAGSRPGGPRVPLSLPAIRSSDQHGRFYAQASPVRDNASARSKTDSAAILRWTPGFAKVDTITFIPVQIPPGTRVVGGITARIPGENVAFKSEPQWAVNRDGSIAILYDTPYRVDILGANGVRRRGQPINYEPVKLTEGHRREWCRQRERPSPWLAVDRESGEQRIVIRRTRCKPPSTWPVYLPPFVGLAIALAPDGSVWIQRTVPADEPATFDVIDSSARLIEKIRLPAHRRLVGFGDGVVYAAFRNEVDLEFLERYRY